MRERLLIERLSAEIQKASAAGDDVRARRLAGLQREVLGRIMRDVAAEPTGESVGVPLAPRRRMRKPRQAVAR
jgi:hypothetical protein